MQQRGGREPGDEGRVLDRVPAPVAAPREDHVGPPGAQADAQREEEPAAEGPPLRALDPLGVAAPLPHGGEGEGEGHGQADVAEEERGRVQHHGRVQQQRVEAGRHRPGRRGQERVGAAVDGHEGREERADGAQDEHGAGGEAVVVAPRRANGEEAGGQRQQQQPEQERPLLPGPEAGQTIERRERGVRVLGHVGEGEVLGQEGDHEHRAGHQRAESDAVGGRVAVAQQIGPPAPHAGGQQRHGGERQDEGERESESAEDQHLISRGRVRRRRSASGTPGSGASRRGTRRRLVLGRTLGLQLVGGYRPRRAS